MNRRQFLKFTITMLPASLIPGGLTGCSATDTIAPVGNAVYPLQLGSTAWGITRAIAEKPGTLLLMKDNCVMFVWSLKDAWAFVGIDVSKMKSLYDWSQISGGANLVNAKTMSDMEKFLTGSAGWRIITSPELPARILNSLNAGAFSAFIGSMTTEFLVVPAGLLLDDSLLDEYQGLKEWY